MLNTNIEIRVRLGELEKITGKIWQHYCDCDDDSVLFDYETDSICKWDK
jgi:hypothetical protein